MKKSEGAAKKSHFQKMFKSNYDLNCKKCAPI